MEKNKLIHPVIHDGYIGAIKKTKSRFWGEATHKPVQIYFATLIISKTGLDDQWC